jgi:uncharacterized membrane protein
MSEKNNQPVHVSTGKFAVMVTIVILWLAYLTVVAVMRRMGC